MQRERNGPILTNFRFTFSFQNSSINTIVIKCSNMKIDFLNVQMGRLMKLSILILSEIFSPPCNEFDHYMEAKIYFSFDCCHYFLNLQDGKLVWLFDYSLFFLVNYFTNVIVSYDRYALLTPLLLKTFSLKMNTHIYFRFRLVEFSTANQDILSPPQSWTKQG